jgi:hypothetical protein
MEDKVNRYLWDRMEGTKEEKCHKCGKVFSDGWKVSVNSREEPTQVYFSCHDCARTKPRVREVFRNNH